MKYTICLSLAVSITSLITSTLPAHAQTGHSLLSDSQKASLKSLGIKVAIPKYVPQGFRVATIRTEPCRDGERADANGVCRFRPGYTVLYRNAQNHCFVECYWWWSWWSWWSIYSLSQYQTFGQRGCQYRHRQRWR
ncbi:MAG: hypothetical protein ACKO7R_09005 [Pseudanabaena sp.]